MTISKRPHPKKILSTLVITGMSGSGKSTALKALEDVGYFCVDNLPVAMLPEFLRFQERTASDGQKIALVMDIREGSFLEHYRHTFDSLKKEGFPLEVLFLDARDQVLIRRFNQTRRQHPLKPKGKVAEGIAMERERMVELREYADKVLDTSNMNVHQLRRTILEFYGAREGLGFIVHLISFGFKHGIPEDANLVLDVRFLPNPYFVEELKRMNGTHKEVRSYVLDHPNTESFMQHIKALLEFLLPQYKSEGKPYLAIAVGCTGGCHRSVAIVEYLREMFTKKGEEVIVTHRDLELEE